MTAEEVRAMTDEELRIRVVELQGWTRSALLNSHRSSTSSYSSGWGEAMVLFENARNEGCDRFLDVLVELSENTPRMLRRNLPKNLAHIVLWNITPRLIAEAFVLATDADSIVSGALIHTREWLESQDKEESC